MTSRAILAWRFASSACPAASQAANSSGVSSVMRPRVALRKSVSTISAAFCRFTRPPPIMAPRFLPMASSSASSGMAAMVSASSL